MQVDATMQECVKSAMHDASLTHVLCIQVWLQLWRR